MNPQRQSKPNLRSGGAHLEDQKSVDDEARCEGERVTDPTLYTTNRNLMNDIRQSDNEMKAEGIIR